jgi:hypothetical protein
LNACQYPNPPAPQELNLFWLVLDGVELCRRWFIFNKNRLIPPLAFADFGRVLQGRDPKMAKQKRGSGRTCNTPHEHEVRFCTKPNTIKALGSIFSCRQNVSADKKRMVTLIIKSIKNTVLYSELDQEKRKIFFDRKDKKFLHNIDSLYYVVKVKNDWNYDKGCLLFRDFLEVYRKQAIKSFEPLVIFQNDERLSILGTEFIMQGIGSAPYLYDISKVDKYMMFVIGHQLNENTPEIWVQLRSQNLWLFGEYKAVEESLNDVKRILDVFGIEIESVSENRIDYAYHTNYIQDPTNFFQPKNFNRMQKSRFERWSLEGSFSGEFETEADYFTLGRKKSNNLFFRTYDKTKEVIEQGYKQFFIKIWFLEKMISYFDMYCIEKAFLQPSRTNYKYLDIARLEFYIEHGKNEKHKTNAAALIKEKTIDYAEVKTLADLLVPKVTKILNIELETKRKFYYSMDESVDTLLKLHSKDVPDYAKKLYLKLDNKQVFHDHIVCNNEKQEGVIRFLDYKAKNRLGKPWTEKSKFPTADWWTRLQRVKVHRKFDVEEVKLMREYQKTLSATLLKKRITNAVSTYSLYVHGEDVRNDTYNDVLDYMATLNESDMEKAIEYKRKKMTLLQNRLGEVEGVSKIDKHFKLYDSETGQTF